MRKPTDPRHHGLKEPVKVFTKTDHIFLADLDVDSKVPLQAVIDVWHRMHGNLLLEGYRLTEGPHFVVHNYYGNAPLGLMYSYEWDNFNYAEEMLAYDLAIATYELDLAAFLQREKEISKHPPNLGEKIERAKQRLANLEATRDGQPLPFPEL